MSPLMAVSTAGIRSRARSRGFASAA
jgi:hypothetical protein